jgi:hypothetical protein
MTWTAVSYDTAATLTYGPSQTNKTISIYTSLSLRLFFYNETNQQLLAKNWSLQLYGEPYATNTTFNGTELNISVAVPSNYTIRYWYNADVPREYYIEINEQSFNELDLYMIDEEISQFYLPVIKNPYGAACTNVVVKLLRYYVNDNAYNIVEMARTDSQGSAVLRVEPNTVAYKMIFDGDCGYFVSTPQKFTSSTDDFTLAASQSVLSSWLDAQNAGTSLTFNNETGTFIFTWDGSSGNTITEGCLYVTQMVTGIKTIVANNCSTSTAGSLIYTVTNTNQTKFIATGSIYDAYENQLYYEILEYDYRRDFETFGLTGVFLTLLVVLAFAFIPGGTSETTLFGALAAIVLMSVFGIFYGEWTTYVGILVIAVIFAFKMRST